MTRAITSTVTKARHRKTLKLAKGYVGRASKCYRLAKPRVEKGFQYSYRDRRKKKSEFRSLWIVRINAGIRAVSDLCYSKFMNLLKLHGIFLNKKMISELAMNHADEFKALVEMVSTKPAAQTAAAY